MNLSEPFIRRPVATTLLSLAIVLAGILGFRALPVAPLPKVDFPTVNVTASLPGASPETMASSVATPLERRFGRIAGVTEITSSSTVGQTSITLQFDLDRDVASAGRDVQAAIAAAGGELPPNLPSRPTFRNINPADTPIMIVSLTSAVLPLSQVFDQANTILAQKISQVEGVGQVFVGGGQQPAVRVQIDPAKLAAMGLAMADVRAVLSGATANGPKGTIVGEGTALTVTANDQLFKASDFARLVIATGLAGGVRLSDVATVIDDVENSRVAAWTDGERSVLVIIRRQPGANIIETNERVKSLLPQLTAQISPTIKTEVALDRTQTIRASVREVEHTLMIGIALVIGVVFVFLRSARATAIPSVAVPLSLIGTCAVMYLLDYSIDNLSLMALTISTGFVVDDAIVVTENVARYLEKGLDPMKAALEGARQIGFTIVSITVSLLAVFLPILLMGGVIGRLFREFAVVLAVAIAVSAVLSLTLTPMMCARLLKRDDGNHGKLYQWSERGFEALANFYGRILDWVLDHRKLMLLVTLLTVAATVGLFIIIPKGLFPQQDNGLVFGMTEAPQDVSFASMKERQEKLNALLKKEGEIEHFVVFIGSGGGGSSTNTGTVFMALRTVPPREVSADSVVARLRPQVAKLGGINAYMQAAQDIRVGGRSARTQYQYTLQSSDLPELRTWAPRVFEAMRKLPSLKDVATDQQNAGLQLDITIDRDRASSLGVSARAVDDALYDSFGQRQVATTFTALNQYRVVLETTPEMQHGEDSVDSLYVKSDSGGMVPLREIAKRSISSAPLAINHQGQFPSVTISFNLAEGSSLGQAMTDIRQAELGIGLPPTVQALYSGTAQAFQDSLRTQPLLLLAALITVYIVLGMLYESFIHPITILSTLPSAGLGALIALYLCKTEFSLIALIGIILLIGIVKKNAIMVVDFALETERDEGLSTLEAIRKACLLRFRPILMTTVAALLGGLPLALGTGPGSELRKPLGITIVGGLLLSQLITLFTTPVIYLSLDRFTSKKNFLKRGTEEGDGAAQDPARPAADAGGDLPHPLPDAAGRGV